MTHSYYKYGLQMGFVVLTLGFASLFSILVFRLPIGAAFFFLWPGWAILLTGINIYGVIKRERNDKNKFAKIVSNIVISIPIFLFAYILFMFSILAGLGPPS